ncbi:hypothetical protein CDAR_223571 [Caerostris darwini]|uniref:Uncharacterized protein n=1 Tax=Caerostris darwini TaxID=1538125 RepID=A0AAV4VMD3_9ARAC|nr:hypothetical protein CDAR_223571 [Caerostris darwini]
MEMKEITPSDVQAVGISRPAQSNDLKISEQVLITSASNLRIPNQLIIQHTSQTMTMNACPRLEILRLEPSLQKHVSEKEKVPEALTSAAPEEIGSSSDEFEENNSSIKKARI